GTNQTVTGNLSKAGRGGGGGGGGAGGRAPPPPPRGGGGPPPRPPPPPPTPPRPCPSFFRACQPRDERIKSEARAARVSRALLDSTKAACSLGSTLRLSGPPCSEPSTAGPARAKRRGCLSAASSAPPLGGPRSTGHRRAALARGWRRVSLVTFFARAKKVTSPLIAGKRRLQPNARRRRTALSEVDPAPRPAHRPAARSAHTGSCRRPARTPATRHAGTGASARSAHEAAC
ncbi:hypothetical protein M2299_003481, partial [Stenotrophomonas sp. 1278]|nr:hypothetical protein [Stenotrophomonas sp. 1278]